jgi:hypothetical protein
MRKIGLVSIAAFIMLSSSILLKAQQISGDYIETRNADVWTGACVANGELNLAGDQAILAWRVSKGQYDGVALDGLGVVGVVKASATLGDQYRNPYPTHAVMIVDSKATEVQQKALVHLAQSMSGELLNNVVDVKVATIDMQVTGMESHHSHDATTSLRAGAIVGVETRSITANDHLCGNENVYYSPLVKLAHSMPAVAELDEYDGPGLGVSWTLRGKRSAFVGRFSF